jgi:hypothetical protein
LLDGCAGRGPVLVLEQVDKRSRPTVPEGHIPLVGLRRLFVKGSRVPRSEDTIA